MTVIDIIRIIAPEFNDVGDDTLSQYVEIILPMVSRKQFGNLYKQGLAYLICHKLKMAGFGDNPLGDIGAIGAGFAVGSVSEGGSSVSFGANQTSNLAADAELGLTAYGVQYLQLRRSVIIPIHVSGEPIERPSAYKPEDFGTVPIASDKRLGGVKVRPGYGLKISKDGVLSIDRASKRQVDERHEEGNDG